MSLVDRPAFPDSTFVMTRAADEWAKFESPAGCAGAGTSAGLLHLTMELLPGGALPSPTLPPATSTYVRARARGEATELTADRLRAMAADAAVIERQVGALIWTPATGRSVVTVVRVPRRERLSDVPARALAIITGDADGRAAGGCDGDVVDCAGVRVAPADHGGVWDVSDHGHGGGARRGAAGGG